MMKSCFNIYIKKGITILILLIIPIVLCSHDLYVKMNTYFLKPNKETTLSLYNGTFERSENIITRDRMLDASLVYNKKRVAIDESQWTDKDSTITQFKFTPVESGTYVTGVSTKARNIKLNSDKFNNYLEHDGVLDMLKYRTKNNLLEEDAVESYQKHVKAIFQVGETKILGYPIEFVPLSNPYEKYSGEKLKVKLLLDGKPLSNQLVYANYLEGNHSHTHDHHHEHDSKIEKHTHTDGQKIRTNEEGIIEVDLPEDGIYYLRTIHMVNINDHETLTHESKWATLTFEVTHNHNENTHKHEHEDHIPTWVFLVGSILIIGVLFLIFKK